MPIVKTLPCIQCHETTDVEVTQEEYVKLLSGVHIQTIFPDKDANFRELLLTGTHPACWEAIFADFKDEDEDEDEVVEPSDDDKDWMDR